MIGIHYDIGDLFNAAFGIQPTFKLPDTLGANGHLEGFKDIEIDRKSQYDTPVIGSIVFAAGDYFVYDNNGNIVRKSFERFELPVAVLASVRRSKKIRISSPSANKSSVKELFSFRDWDVAIRGIALPDISQPQGLVNPMDQIDKLYEWEEIIESIRIEGGLYINKKIDNIVILELDVRQQKGAPKVIPFMIRAISDQPMELTDG